MAARSMMLVAKAWPYEGSRLYYFGGTFVRPLGIDGDCRGRSGLGCRESRARSPSEKRGWRVFGGMMGPAQ